MGDLSKHFSRKEFACKCGCGFDTVDLVTLSLAEEVRCFVGQPISPTSGCRCLSHNKRIGSKDTSQHIKARAVDLPVPDPKEVYDFLDKKYQGRYGFGLYKHFVHIDSRSGKAGRWKG